MINYVQLCNCVCMWYTIYIYIYMCTPTHTHLCIPAYKVSDHFLFRHVGSDGFRSTRSCWTTTVKDGIQAGKPGPFHPIDGNFRREVRGKSWSITDFLNTSFSHKPIKVAVLAKGSFIDYVLLSCANINWQIENQHFRIIPTVFATESH